MPPKASRSTGIHPIAPLAPDRNAGRHRRLGLRGRPSHSGGLAGGSRLFKRRPRYRAPWAAPPRRQRRDPVPRRARHHLPDVHGRARVLAPHHDRRAPGRVRRREPPGRHHYAHGGGDRDAVRSALARRHRARRCGGDVVDGDRAEATRRPGRAQQRARPAGGGDPAVPGSRDDPLPGHGGRGGGRWSIDPARPRPRCPRARTDRSRLPAGIPRRTLLGVGRELARPFPSLGGVPRPRHGLRGASRGSHPGDRRLSRRDGHRRERLPAQGRGRCSSLP